MDAATRDWPLPRYAGPATDEPIVGDIWSLVSEDTDICRVMYLYKHIRSGIAVFGG